MKELFTKNMVNLKSTMSFFQSLIMREMDMNYKH